MRARQIVPGGERVGNAPFSGPALRAHGDRHSVLRRSGRRSALSFSRRNERPAPTLGDPLYRRIDWPLVAFCVGWAIGFGVLAYIGMERGGW